jgi:DNA primase
MKYPPSLLDDIRARLPVSQVVGRKVQLKKAGREWKGLSPFKQERTPSFYINDQKGFYHCFASGEHGDIFTFLMKTEGLSFPEAIERLAEEAGVPLPKGEARNPALEDQRKRLYDLLEASAVFFETAYASPAAEAARRYVSERRGLSAATVAAFRLGFAPDSRNALKQHLARLGFTNEEMIVSGMLIGGEDIPVSYDRFRNRVMFPITDLRGRVVAFGGRALEADVPAKYLNSPETPLFHKGNILFNAHKARSAAHKAGRVVAVEGYMDVVALAAAGFGEAVAPLGTALTEDQLKLLWRFAHEPILCFDGDSAGRKAAHRALDVALPQLEPGKSLRFAFLPDGLDPDDLVRQQGRAAMETVLSSTRSFVDVLFEREWGGGDWSTPERRARLEADLGNLVSRIGHEQVRSYYADDIRERLTRAFGRPVALPTAPPPAAGDGRWDEASREPSGGGAPRGGGSRRPRTPFQPGRLSVGPARRFGPPALLDAPLAASPSLRQAIQDARLAPRDALVLRTLLNHAWLIEDHWEDVAGLDLGSAGAEAARDALLNHHAAGHALDIMTVRSHLRNSGLGEVLEQIERSGLHRGDRFAEPGADASAVRAGWHHLLTFLQRDSYERQLKAAHAAWMATPTDEAWERIAELKRLLAERVDLDEAG